MNLQIVFPLLTVLVLGMIAYVGGTSGGLQSVFGILIPYAAVIIFIAGVVKKFLGWLKSPVPFRIPTTCGQQKSMPWIKQNKIDNPSDAKSVVVRMLLEILLFRSLFRNTKNSIKEGKIVYELEIWLWLFGLIFHYSFFAVLVRHFRFFLEPVPGLLKMIEALDGFLQIGLPGVLMSGVLLFGAACYLLARRLTIPQVKYISLAADYFPLFLIIGIAGTGIYMRYISHVDITVIKQLTMGLVTFKPVIPAGVSVVFYIHLFFVCVLLAYFPFSKLMHAGGVFLSPTRNLPNDSRMKRHINPWNPKLKFVTYEDYENEFREKMIEAGLPVEKE